MKSLLVETLMLFSMVANAHASQSCNVAINCNFVIPGSVIGTIVGNPSTGLTVTTLLGNGGTVEVDNSASCTSEGKFAFVPFQVNGHSLWFRQTRTGFIGIITTSGSDGGMFCNK